MREDCIDVAGLVREGHVRDGHRRSADAKLVRGRVVSDRARQHEIVDERDRAGVDLRRERRASRRAEPAPREAPKHSAPNDEAQRDHGRTHGPLSPNRSPGVARSCAAKSARCRRRCEYRPACDLRRARRSVRERADDGLSFKMTSSYVGRGAKRVLEPEVDLPSLYRRHVD